ncbi:plasmid recombination protein [Treponema sp.]|uniref:plasmid recombination protein n=1 Tax=Treponema sp. TaxID=166 RepID=UPI00257CFB80|nr:plasmid recombination protein [Treponema sp.]
MEVQKKYGIFRIEKIKLCDGGEAMGRLKHAFREFKNDSFDPELTEKNLAFQHSSAKDVMKAYKERVQSITTEKYKPPKNAVGLYECIVTSTAGAIPEEREYEFFEKTYQQLCRTFGEKNVLAGTSHKDETTIHTHWFITPIFNTTSVLRRTREEKKNGTCRTITQPQLNATHWTGSPTLMSELQDTMWEGIFKDFGLERGEIDLTSDRTKKKKNVRSDIRKRDLALSKKEKTLERITENQKKEGERLEEQRVSQNQRDDDFLDKKRSFQNEKAEFEKEKEGASQKAVEQYDEYMKSEKFQNADFPCLPAPESKEGVWGYHLRIRPVFDAIVSKAKQFFEQIKSLKKSHQEEIQKLKDEHQADLEKTKANAEAEKQTAVKTEVEKAVLAKAAEKDETINTLKEEIQKEKSEKEKWYTMLFRKFTIKIGGKPVEVNKGLTDAYIEKSTQLAEWENRDGDELITLGSSYKKYRVHNWKDYQREKSRPRSLDYDMSR